jgi:hypothetical protein
VAREQLVDGRRRTRHVERAPLVGDREQRHAARPQQVRDVVQQADRVGDVLEHMAEDHVTEATRHLLGDGATALEHPGDWRDVGDRDLELLRELLRAAHVGDVAASHVGSHRREIERAHLEAMVALQVDELAEEPQAGAAVILPHDLLDRLGGWLRARLPA